MPTKGSSATPITPSSSNTNIRQQIISKTPRIKRKRLNTKEKKVIETVTGIINEKRFVSIDEKSIVNKEHS